jgi:hypothetical protein
MRTVCSKCNAEGVTIHHMVHMDCLAEYVCSRCKRKLEGAWQQWGRYIPARGRK